MTLENAIRNGHVVVLSLFFLNVRCGLVNVKQLTVQKNDIIVFRYHSLSVTSPLQCFKSCLWYYYRCVTKYGWMILQGLLLPSSLHKTIFLGRNCTKNKSVSLSVYYSPLNHDSYKSKSGWFWLTLLHFYHFLSLKVCHIRMGFNLSSITRKLNLGVN